MSFKIFKMFFNNKKNDEEINFFKNSKKNFIVFFFILLAAALTICLSLFFRESKKNDIDNEIIVEIPMKEDIEQKDIEKARRIASEAIGASCTVKISKTFEYSNPLNKNVMLINFAKPNNDDDYINNKIFSLGFKLKEVFPNNIDIEFKEEMIISEVYKPKSYYVDSRTAIFVAICAMIIITLFYIIAFRKIKGVFVAISLLVSILFGITLTLGLFMSIISVLYSLDCTFVWSSINQFFVATIIAFAISYIYNSAILFTNIKNEKLKTSEKSLIETSNLVINKNLKSLINNNKVIILIPAVAMLICKIIESVIYGHFQAFLQGIPFIAIYVTIGFACFTTSIYILVPLWEALSNKKQKAK